MNSLAPAPDPADGRAPRRRSTTTAADGRRSTTAAVGPAPPERSAPPAATAPPPGIAPPAVTGSPVERARAALVPGDAARPPVSGPLVAPGRRRVREMSTRELGRAGEDLAAGHLTACGWQLVERNLQLRHGELDIVALDHATLVFVEVKTRRSFVTGVPQAAVTPDKLRRLRRLAGEYLMERSTPHRDVRIDVIGIHADPDGTFTLEHLEGVS